MLFAKTFPPDKPKPDSRGSHDPTTNSQHGAISGRRVILYVGGLGTMKTDAYTRPSHPSVIMVRVESDHGRDDQTVVV